MPQINRIRVNNVKYNFGTQYYDDFCMRFNCRNTIYDLANGGGKSLLMLLLLQTVIPNCTLDEKQPIEKLFRQGSGNTVIHSLVEWKLDSGCSKDNFKYMTTGFCARKAKDTENASVEYFNYCIFYREFGENDIKNLPLTNNGERITYNGLKSYLRELEKNDFHVSVKIFERKGEYQQFISQYGLYESEWEIIRGINQTEGHVRTYFETNYKTSRKVVEDLLIEEIIQKSFYNKLSVGNDEGQMAQTLMDIKDQLVQLSKKHAQISNYDRQIAAMNDFAEYVSGYVHLYEEKERLKQQLFDMLLVCKKKLEMYREQEESRQQKIKELDSEQNTQKKLVHTAEIVSEQMSLKNVEELIAANEGEKSSLEQRRQKLQERLNLTQAVCEYKEYMEYERLFDEISTAISARTKDHGELAEELAELAAALKQLNEQEEHQLTQEITALEGRKTETRELLKEAQETETRLREKQITVTGLLDFTQKSITQKEKRASSLMEKTGILVMENAPEALESCKESLKNVQGNLLDFENELEKVRWELLDESGKNQAEKTRSFMLKEQFKEAEKAFEQQQKAHEKLEQLKAVYLESDTENIQAVILENYRKMETDSIRLQEESERLKRFLANTQNGTYSGASVHRNKLKEYLVSQYGEDVKEGSQWLEELNAETRRHVQEQIPFADYAFVIENDFNRVRQDKVLENFGRSEYVVPIISSAVADSEIVLSGSQYMVFARKDTSFLKDEVRRRQEMELAEEELETIRQQQEKLSDRKGVVWEDYLAVQHLTSIVAVSADEQVKALQEQIAQTEETILECDKRICQLQTKESELVKSIKEAQKTLENSRMQCSNLEEVTALSLQIGEGYQKKKELTNELSETTQSLLQAEQKHQTAQGQLDVVLQQLEDIREQLAKIRRKWQETYQAYYDEKHTAWSRDRQPLDRGVLESRFAGLKMVLDEKNADISDKEALLKQYRLAMEKCKKAIIERAFSLETIAGKVRENDIGEISTEALQHLKEEITKTEQQIRHTGEELEAQNALMNRLQGSIAHGISQMQERYGDFEAFACDNPEQFIVQHKQQIHSIAQDMERLKKEAGSAAKQMQDFIVMEKDLSRIVEKTGMQVPEHIEGELSVDVDLTDYEAVQKEFDRLGRLEFRKLEEFTKKKEKLMESLSALDANELAAEVRVSVNAPQNIAATKELTEHIRETNTFIQLEKERVSKGIEDMERIKVNFENRCIQTCCNIKTELDRLPKLSCITMDHEVISIIGLQIPYIKEELYKERMASYIDETVVMAESFESAQERLKYIRNRLTWKRLFSVIVTDMNSIRVNLYKRERIKDQSRYLKYEEAVGSTGQSQGIYIQFLIAVINYISSINAASKDNVVLGKTIFIDNPFGAAKDIYIWEPIFKLLKTNHVQLIVPARGATPAITGRFDVNYILGQKLVDNRQQTVVVDYYSRTKNEELEYTKMDYEQAVFDFA